MTKITKKEIATLFGLNEQRAPIQTKLVEEAQRLLKIWTEHQGWWTDFCTAEVVKDGAFVAVTFTWGDTAYSDFGLRTEEFPIEWFLSSKWADETSAAIAEKKQAEEQRKARKAALEAELAALGRD